MASDEVGGIFGVFEVVATHDDEVQTENAML